MVAGTIIGASIFVQPSEIARHLETPAQIMVVWLACGLLTLCGAMVCAELASAFPYTGGVYVFLRDTYSTSSQSIRAKPPLVSVSSLPGFPSITICAMRIVDFHNHYYPPSYVRALETASVVKVTYDADGNPCVHYPGDYNILVPGHRDIAYRQRVLDEQGVTTQVLSFTTPGVHVEVPNVAVTLAREINDAFAAVVRERSPRFTALATLPLNDPAASVVELERAMTELRLPGAMVFSNVNHVALADVRFAPLWKKADELGAVIYIHPTDPAGVEAMLDYWLMPLVGFLMDTTLAAATLVFSGVVARHPRIRWVLTHMGGAIPYLAERLDRGYRAFADCRQHIDRPPSDYLRQFYYDTVNFNPSAVRLALDFAGPDRILAGSDYPHQIGSIPLMIETIRGLDVSDEVRRRIFGGNAAALLGLG
jgi:aminocarboxymuconate-semialdehyde decarboxylase